MINVCMIFFIKTEIKIIKFCIFFKRMTVVGESIVELSSRRKFINIFKIDVNVFAKCSLGKMMTHLCILHDPNHVSQVV